MITFSPNRFKLQIFASPRVMSTFWDEKPQFLSILVMSVCSMQMTQVPLPSWRRIGQPQITRPELIKGASVQQYSTTMISKECFLLLLMIILSQTPITWHERFRWENLSIPTGNTRNCEKVTFSIWNISQLNFTIADNILHLNHSWCQFMQVIRVSIHILWMSLQNVDHNIIRISIKSSPQQLNFFSLIRMRDGDSEKLKNDCKKVLPVSQQPLDFHGLTLQSEFKMHHFQQQHPIIRSSVQMHQGVEHTRLLSSWKSKN